MAIHEKNRAVRCYHSVVSLILLLAGGALLGVGIWLHVTDRGGPANLEYTGSNVFDYVLNFGVACMVIGAFLMLTAVAALVSLARNFVGKTFRVIYVLLALVILAALIFICVISILVLTKRDSESVKEFLSDAWEKTAEEQPAEICRIEKEFECRGFEDSECEGCVFGTEPSCKDAACAVCDDAPPNAEQGCYNEIVGDVRRFFLPMSVVSALLAMIVLVDIFVCCAL